MTEEVPTAEPAPTPPSAPPAHSKAPWIVAGVATAIALVAAMVATTAVMKDDTTVVNAAPFGAMQASFNRPVQGEITKISGSEFTVEEELRNGETSTTNVETDKDTRFSQSVDGTLGDLAVGDTISAVGTTAENVFTASQIAETAMFTNIARGDSFTASAPGAVMQGGGGPRLLQADNRRIGEITAIDGDTITLSSLMGESITITTTAATTVRVSKSIKLSNLKVGDTVRVLGETKDDTITANEVTKGVDDDPLAP